MMGMTTTSINDVSRPDPTPVSETGFGMLENLLPANEEEFAPERWIWVTFRVEGVHKYPAALTDPALKSVEFLGYPHRHIFRFKVSVSVVHNDRDIEFIMFKRELQSLYVDGLLEMDYKSCEMLSEDLYKYLAKTYPNRAYKIEVSEDGENGCVLEWDTRR